MNGKEEKYIESRGIYTKQEKYMQQYRHTIEKKLQSAWTQTVAR